MGRSTFDFPQVDVNGCGIKLQISGERTLARESNMPYRTNDDLPAPVRHVLPEHAQDIYREAFNHAFATHGDDATAARIAWTAVKRSYAKIDNTWVPISESARHTRRSY